MGNGWNDVMQANNGGGDSVEFVKTPPGLTKVRLMNSEPKSTWKHWIPQANAGKGMSIVCSGKDTCLICKANKDMEAQGLKKKYSVSRAFAMNALIEINGEKKLQILEKSATFFASLFTLKEQMGELINYEINITRTGSGLNDTKYNVLPVFPPTALAINEAEFLNNLIDLDEYYKVLSDTDVASLMAGGSLSQEEESPQFEIEQ